MSQYVRAPVSDENMCVRNSKRCAELMFSTIKRIKHNTTITYQQLLAVDQRTRENTKTGRSSFPYFAINPKLHLRLHALRQLAAYFPPFQRDAIPQTGHDTVQVSEGRWKFKTNAHFKGCKVVEDCVKMIKSVALWNSLLAKAATNVYAQTRIKK